MNANELEDLLFIMQFLLRISVKYRDWAIFFAGRWLFFISRLCQAVPWNCSKVMLGWRHSCRIC